MEGIIRITGRHNVRLSAIRKVRDGKWPDKIFIEGLRLSREALRSKIRIVECVMTPAMLQLAEGDEVAQKLIGRGVPIMEVPLQLFGSLTDTVNPQGVILIADRPETGPHLVAPERKPGLVIFLQKIGDPSNLGAVYRTAEATGARAVIASVGSANVFSPKAIRASMGANLRIPTWDNAELKECAAWAKNAGLIVRAADISGTLSHFQVGWKKPSMVLFGNEAQGLSGEDLDLADEIFRIPMMNEVESLNLAVSSGIVMYEALRQIDLM